MGPDTIGRSTGFFSVTGVKEVEGVDKSVVVVIVIGEIDLRVCESESGSFAGKLSGVFIVLGRCVIFAVVFPFFGCGVRSDDGDDEIELSVRIFPVKIPDASFGAVRAVSELIHELGKFVGGVCKGLVGETDQGADRFGFSGCRPQFGTGGKAFQYRVDFTKGFDL